MSVPEFIDTATCLCGLLSAPAAAYNGEQIEMWRCIGNPAANISTGNNGKWYNTTLPSQEVSAINEAQNWGDNPPDLSSVFILVDHSGKDTYEPYKSGSSPELVGNDMKCTGKNDTALSGTFYKQGIRAIMSGSSVSMSSAAPTASPSTSGRNTASSKSSASMTSGSTTVSSSASSSISSSTTAPTSSTAASSGANHIEFKTLFIFGLLFAPLLSLAA